MNQGATAGKWAVNLPVAGDWFIESHAYLWKGSWLSDDWKTATPDSPAMVESLKGFADLAVKQHVVPRPGELQGDAASNFLNGNLAMLGASGGTMSQVVDAVKKGSPFGFAPLPAMKVAASAIQFDGNAILKDAEHPDQAWVVMKWAASTIAWPIARGTPPARADLFGAWAKELYGDVAQSIRLPVYRDALANGEGIDPLNLQPRLADIKSGALVPAIKDIFTGERNAEDALRAGKAPMQALLQPVG